jgi:ABC-2 type transport system ATP-binding protein
VTHALDTVVAMCDRAVVLEAGHIIVDGDPALAARTLRQDFEVTRQAEQERERERERVQVDRPTTPATHGTITAVRLLDDDGAALTEVAPGQDLRLQVDVEAPDRLEDWVLGIGIDTPSGQSLYGTNTQLLDQRLPTVEGRQTFEIRLRDVFLGAGQYQIHGALAVWGGKEIHRLAEGVSFSVVSDGRSVGFLGARPSLVTAPPTLLERTSA